MNKREKEKDLIRNRTVSQKKRERERERRNRTDFMVESKYSLPDGWQIPFFFFTILSTLKAATNFHGSF